MGDVQGESIRDEKRDSTSSTTKQLSATPATPPKTPAAPTFQKGLRFYALIVALSFTGLLTGMESTITSNALPTIVADLGGGDSYVWAVNGYFITMTAFQPLFGQLANVFGRRWPMILATAAFVFGSGISGGASNMAMLIAGRVLQGLGGGGINVLIEVIVCDIVPLRQRGNYLATMFGLVALGTALGPFISGLIVDRVSWRWVFYLNLPVGGVALLLLFAFLRVNYNKEHTLAAKLTQLDWIGNAIFVAAITSILIALAWSGSTYPWSSYKVIVPLVVGMLGLLGFFLFEATPKLAPNPMMPLHLFGNRTSATAFVLTFLHSIAAYGALYFLPVYFQGVLLASPTKSGINLLPTILVMIPAAAVGGGLMTKLGKYRMLHFAGYGLMVLGFGLLSMLDTNSSTAEWVIFQIIESAGTGIIISTVLPAVLAPLRESDTALATATWAFMRSFGATWGTAIPAATFNNRFDQLAPQRISSSEIVNQLIGGKAYEHATADYINTLSSVVREQLTGVFSDSLRRGWQVSIAFSALGFLLVALEKDVPLRNELETEYGMEQREKQEGKVENTDEVSKV
ncbi:major facilitator superfamily protein [Xylariales sp. PMI_506]|nr:major facilitator superfamily protein [Xylariales sp. PMI_506]